MKTEIFLAKGRLLVRVRGRLVLDECDALKDAVQSAMTPAVGHVLVDLARTEFVDSAGLGTLVGIKMKANKIKARMTLLNPSAAVEEILTMSKLNEIFEIASGQEAETLAGNVGLSENLIRTLGGAPEVAAAPVVQSAESLKIEESATPPAASESTEMVEDLCRNAVEALRRGSYDESIRYYRRALEINGDYLPARNNLAIVYEKRPEWRQNALEQWEIVLRLSEQLGDAKHKERAEKHLKALREQPA